MARAEFTIDFEVARPVGSGLRFRVAAFLGRVIGWLIGTTAVIQARPVSAKRRAETEAAVVAALKNAPDRPMTMYPAGSVLSSATPASTPDSPQVALRQDDGQAAPGECRRCDRESFVTSDDGLCAGCRADDEPKCHDCGRSDGQLHTHEQGERVCWPCFDERQTAAFGPAPPETGDSADDPRFDPANCFDCGRPLGATFSRGKYTHRPYHPACLELDRGTASAQVLG